MRPGTSITSFTRQEIATLFKVARLKVRVPGLRILRAPKTVDAGRILIVVPRKVGTAPERNLIKRRIRSIFRERHFSKGAYDFVALVGAECKNCSFQELTRLLLLACS